MGKLVLALIVVVFLALIVGIGGYIYFQRASFGPSAGDLEECVTLKYEGQEGINVVFFADSQKEAEKYMRYFLGVEPFNNNEKEFNFYYIKEYKPACEIYKDIALLCYSRDLIKKSASCPNDQIVILNGDYDRSLRSSTYLNIMSINTKHPMSVLPHEFGHSFVNLAEEYQPAKIPRNSPGNCVDDCTKFEGRNDGCFQGCSENDYMRSIENGVMRTLSSDNYGTFNKWVIGKKITELTGKTGGGVSGKVISGEDCSGQDYYLVSGSYNAGINISGKEIVQGCVGDTGSGPYSIDIILRNDKKVNIGQFNPEMIFTDAPGATEVSGSEGIFASPGDNGINGEIYESDIDFYLKVPVVENAKELQIREPGLKIIVSVPICEGGARGDANGDGNVDMGDVTHIEEHFEKGNILYCEGNSDFDGNGGVEIEDAYSLADYFGGARLPLS